MRRGHLLVAMMVVACMAALVACLSDRDVAPAPLPRPAPEPAVARDGAALVLADAKPLRARFAGEQRSIMRRSDGVAVTFVGPAGVPAIRGERVEYARENVIEWYEARPNGIEQGFTIATKQGPLAVDVTLANATAAIVETEIVDLKRTGDDTPAFRYGALSAIDARARVLPSKLSLADDHTIRIEVDDRDATYPITIDPLIWALEQRLTRIDLPSVSRYGIGVGLSGDTLVVGMNGYNSFYGSFISYRRSSEGWKEEALVPLPYNADDNLGINALVEGDRAFIGTIRSGIFFTRIGKTWTLEQALPWSPTFRGTGPLGMPLALQGDTAAVSVPLEMTPFEDAGPSWPGTVHVYSFAKGTWAETATLRSPEPVSPQSFAPVALDGDKLATASGAHVFVFRRTNGSWSLEATLSGEDAVLFGNGLAFCSANELIAGDPTMHAVYVFEHANGTWTRKQKLSPPTIPALDDFGLRVVCKGDEGFVGDPQRAFGGSVFRIERSGGQWAVAEELKPSDVTFNSAFGLSMAFDGVRAAFGAPVQGTYRGAAYVYAKRSALGDACTTHESCSTAFCVDGVCCESECGGGIAGDCLHCAGEGTRGLCRPAAAGYVCRPAIGDCDVEERCDGIGGRCPHDAILANGTTCAGGNCVAGACRPSPAPPATPAPTSDVAYYGGCSSGGSTRTSWPLSIPCALFFLFAFRRRFRTGMLASLVSVAACTSVPEREERSSTAEALVWGEKQKLSAPPGLPLGSYGLKVATSGNTMAVTYVDVANDTGHVFMLERTGNQWVEKTVIVSPEPGGRFGVLAFDGETLAVGAPHKEAGAVFVFVRTNGAWALQAKLVQPDATGGDRFGQGIALEGDRLIAGAPEHDRDPNGAPHGAAYVFVRSNGAWTLETKLGGAPFTRFFGQSIAMSGSRVLIGAAQTATGPNPDSATFFVREGSTYKVEHVATPEVPGLIFGASVALKSDLAVVGAAMGPFGIPPVGGAAYVYRRTNGVWAAAQKLQPSDTSNFDLFGIQVELAGERLAISAMFQDGKGAVYLFAPTGGLFAKTDKLQPKDLTLDDRFGETISLRSDMVLIGAPGHANGRGAVFSMFLGAQGDTCTTSEPCASGFCVDGVCCDAPCGGGDPNDCVACSVTAGAQTNGICAPITRVCRPAANECDVPETCDGKQATCPVDEVAQNGLLCGGGKGSCSGGKCLDAIPITPAPAAPPEHGQPLAAVGGCATAYRSSFPAWSALIVLALLWRRRR